MQEIGITQADFHTYTLRNDKLIARSNPSLGSSTSVMNKGTKFTFNKSLFVENSTFIYLSRNEIEKGAKRCKQSLLKIWTQST